jgi:hypothetical protein
MRDTNKNATNPCSVPICHRCVTPWAVCLTDAKRKLPPPIAVPVVAEAIEVLSSPPKKARIARTTQLEADCPDAPGCAMKVSPPKVPPPPMACISLTSEDPKKAFTSYLLNRIATQTQALEDLALHSETLTSENDHLIDENDWLHTTRNDLVKMCQEVHASKGVHVREVANLKLVLTTKVADLTAEFAIVKAKLNEDSKCDVNFWLAEVQAKKNIVCKLKAELEGVTMTGIPVPDSIDDLAACIKQIVNCRTKKGTHLATKVKIIYESVLTSVFHGCCLSYLLGWTLRPIQGKNPHRRAIKIAKIINLSGSLINLSGYNALRKGMEGDASGKVERNGEWLASRYHVMKCMKAVETAAQVDIPLKPLILTDGIDDVQFEYDKLLASLLTQGVQTRRRGKESSRSPS